MFYGGKTPYEHRTRKWFARKVTFLREKIITGVYISPNNTKNLTSKTLAHLSKTEMDVATGLIPSHIFGGDFNTSSWPETYHEWIQEKGIWELVDPGLPTTTTGGCVDKFQCAPGHYFPVNFLPSEQAGEVEGRESTGPPFYPASIWRDVSLCAHYSAFLKARKK